MVLGELYWLPECCWRRNERIGVYVGLFEHQTKMANAELYAGVRVLEFNLGDRFLVCALALSTFYVVVRSWLWFALC